MDNEFLPDLYELEDENGNKQTFELLDAMEYEDEKYYALTPYYENGDEALEDSGDVDSFDDEIRLFTQLGELTIKGKDLHINEISVESGDVSVEGDIWALVYGEKDRKKKLSAIGKIFR